MIQTLTLRVDSVVKDVQEMQYTQKEVEELKQLHVKLVFRVLNFLTY